VIIIGDDLIIKDREKERIRKEKEEKYLRSKDNMTLNIYSKYLKYICVIYTISFLLFLMS